MEVCVLVQTQTIIIMRRIKALLLLALMLIMGLVAKADNDRVITYEQLPQPAKDMIKAHFASKEIKFNQNFQVVEVDND